ncbi:Putative activity regulator of membrane protease YbbK [hydrothermal vent metagenome]|uniref:Putative activity regulator of membrane protease YbbK n=1 Tax=hydrothermal vent metagenome TaxID=652676 RepID=A0A1W1C9E5_9ZZZZ
MFEMLNNSIVWWHWIVVGLILIISEMATGTFISLGFGIAALVVGIVDIIVPLGFVYQLSLWIVLSPIVVFILFKWFDSQPTITSSGQSDYRFDTLGTVTQAIHPHKRGKVAFDAPVLGNTEWHATANDELAEGDRIKIVEVNGQLIQVAPIDKT